MESIAAPKSYLGPTGGLLRVTKCSKSSQPTAGQQRNTVAQVSTAGVSTAGSAQLRLDNSAHRGERPRVRIFH